ncbi:hypothetical protein GBAR_LOCUS16689 [Geodia barretti]|uniref:Uncharacterized protein n=1 Tax=Geodia barretti TaxID=519541 RepID=A0AA35SGV6_GEOBA|nr:hypothetical protein GBAR_LOCUS16689 [Geodia barretti]
MKPTPTSSAQSLRTSAKVPSLLLRGCGLDHELLQSPSQLQLLSRLVNLCRLSLTLPSRPLRLPEWMKGRHFQSSSVSPHTQGAIDITSKVGMKYMKLGTLLLEDNDGSIMPTIKSQCLLDADSITMEIMRRWLRGKGKQPVTWRTLTDSLKSIGLSPLASSIEHSLTSSS